MDITEKGYWNSSPVKNYESVFYLRPDGNSTLCNGPFVKKFGLINYTVDGKVVQVPHDESLRKFFIYEPGRIAAKFENFICPFMSLDMELKAVGGDAFILTYTFNNRAKEDKEVSLLMTMLADRKCGSVEHNENSAKIVFDLKSKLIKPGEGTIDFSSLREWFVESDKLELFLDFEKCDVYKLSETVSRGGEQKVVNEGLEYEKKIFVPAGGCVSFETALAFTRKTQCKDNITAQQWQRFVQKLPQPAFENAAQKQAYYKSWYVLFFNEVRRKGIHWCLTGLGFPSVWVWDTSPFIANAYMNVEPLFVQGMVDAQLDSLKETGMMPLHVLLGFMDRRERKDEITQIPLVADTAWKVFEKTADTAFAQKAYRELSRNYQWYQQRRTPDASVPLWGIDDKRAPYHYGPESGMDNCPIYKDGPAYSVAINSAKVSFERAMSNFAAVVDSEQAAVMWAGRCDQTKRYMLENMWDEADCYYYALTYNLRKIRIKTSDIYPAFYLNIIPDEKARIIAKIFSDEFMTDYGLTSVSMKEKCFDPSLYALGSVWPFMNYMVYKGLVDYGCHDTAAKILEGVVRAVTEFPSVFECFNPAEKTLGRLKDGPICIPHMSFCAAGIISMIITNCGLAGKTDAAKDGALQTAGV